MIPKTICPRQLLRSRLETKRRTSRSSSPPTSSTRSLTIATSPRWSWSSRKPVTEVVDRPPSPPSDEEHFHILKARQRLARREIELRQIIRHCNREIDGVRQKLFKDLRVMEVFKEEIDKAGSGDLREELEGHFRDEYIAYVATLTKQKELVEDMHERKQIAMREVDGIAWSDELLARRLEDCTVEEYIF